MPAVIGASLAVLVTATLATTAMAQGATIVPGQSVGAFRVGGDLGAVVSALGPLFSQEHLHTPAGELVSYFWPLRRIGVIADQTTRKIVGVAVSLEDTYRTDKGIGAGAEVDAVRAAYGPEERLENDDGDQTLVYDRLGVAFVVDKDGALNSRVSVIFVFTPGHYRDVFGGDEE